MCHDDDSRPPSPPHVGPVGEHELFELTGADGNTFAAYRAAPEGGGNGKNIVVLPDVRGLHPYYEQVTIRFAEAGFNTVALDYFGRTNGVARRGDDFDWQTEFPKVKPDEVVSDAAAAVSYLSATNPGPTYSVGFCFGGSHSWRLSASDLPLAGCMGFYGRPVLIADAEPDMHRPLLLLVAGADQATPQAEFQELEGRLSAKEVPHEMYIYDGAPHSFFDRSFDQWREACDDAWARMLSFTSTYA
jgi:carboxymethylenebutenolidase